jgi:DnaJ-class molecular chaperone with C-terminal Zn finger domain
LCFDVGFLLRKYTAHITLEQALIGCTVELKTLDGRLLRIPINDIVCPGYTKTVPKEGIPDFSTGASSGDLIIEFDVQFPKKLSDTQKNLITLSIGPQPEEKVRYILFIISFILFSLFYYQITEKRKQSWFE